MARIRSERERRPTRPMRSRGGKKGRSPWRTLWFYARHLALWLTVGVLGYWLWLDREVAETFRDKQWSLPARVYARALELYPGASVSRERLLRELAYLGYEKVDQPSDRGEFATHGATVEIFARGFDYWDMPEVARHIRIAFDRNGVTRVSDVRDMPVDLLRLDPVEIGSINPTRFEDRKLLGFEELQSSFVDALIAVEDRRFFEHHGVDLFGLARAVLTNLMARRWVQGGSTLTQQLVKNFYLTSERTLTRKLIEMMMAVSLEFRFGKREILETYVNEVFLGQEGDRAIHGFELAAQFYFGRPLRELDMGSVALLIGMIKGPSVYDPRRHPEAARQRRDVVVNVLLRQGLLDATQAERIKSSSVTLRPRSAKGGAVTPAFMTLVKRQLQHEYSPTDLNEAGLNIFTTLDIDLQEQAEKSVQRTLTRIEGNGKRSGLQAAAVVVEPHSGEILALIGDRNPAFAGFNRALDARRPIGSVIKPFVYAYALSQPERYALYTSVEDAAVTWTDRTGKAWQPRNFDGQEYGQVSLLEALTRSLNLATVNLALALDLTRIRDYLGRLGFEGKLPAYPSLVLGAVEMTPLQLTELYTTLANDGYQVPLRAIGAVTNHEHQKLKRYGLELRSAMEPETAALVRFALTRVVSQGTARAVRQSLPAVQPLAGKTGTSNDNRDSWFAGFGNNRLGVVWVGRDDNSATGLTGSSGALPVWSAIMQATALEPIGERLPDGLAWEWVDLRRGIAVPAQCPNAERIPVHRRSTLDRATQCVESLAPPRATDGIMERMRGFFGQ